MTFFLYLNMEFLLEQFKKLIKLLLHLKMNITYLFWNLRETTDNRNKNVCSLHFAASSWRFLRQRFELGIYWWNILKFFYKKNTVTGTEIHIEIEKKTVVQRKSYFTSFISQFKVTLNFKKTQYFEIRLE